VNRRTPFVLVALAAVMLAFLAASCAVTDAQDELGQSAYAPRTDSPARIGLPPQYRAFYDELRDEGDWTLIEPYGYVFRPRVNFVAWRPYQEGWWEPSDYYGWIWNTNEPFGWITYHYGSWFYDEYQGWVWQPGPVWGPAWVAWVEAGDYIGWAPLAPSAYSAFDQIPDGVFTYASGMQFTSPNVAQSAMFVSKLPDHVSEYHAIVNVGRANGVSFNKGPSLMTLQARGAALGTPADPARLPRVKLAGVAPKPNEADLQSRTNRMVTEGARELRRMRADVKIVEPPQAPVEQSPRYKPPVPPAPPDTTVSPGNTGPTGPGGTPDPNRKPTPRRQPPRQQDAAPDSTRHR
jgi:hypothetical protein